jgi:hypothetical protein
MSAPRTANVNVTLPDEHSGGGTFPCPLCEVELDLRNSRRLKPYCVCNACGVQLFFRGRAGIARLRELLKREQTITGALANTAAAVIAFRRLERLRAQKASLEDQRAFFSRDQDLENAISTIERQIERAQDSLRAMADRDAR